ncbi:primosomal protein [Microbacterium sp. bgisy189]|uniref:primosomal protein n=1 Tax=Microbacterium sp. bgisy189 TaxID=3413798 RepID=UPI003EBCFD21
MTEEERPEKGRKPRFSAADSGSRRDTRGAGASRGGARGSDSGAQRRSFGDRDRKPYGDREKRPFERRDDRSTGERKPNRDRDRKPYGDRERKPSGDRDRKPYGDREKKPFERRDAKPYRDRDRKPYGDRDRKPYGDRDRKPYGDRDRKRYGARDGDRRNSRPPQSAERRAAQGPEIPEEITARDLPGAARNELKTLSKENAEQVARHLAMAARLIDDDPDLAHQHALAASRRAGRVAVVRETVGITAYATGDYALALRELRTYRRISGSDEQIALIVDSERGVGRADRALEEGRGVDRSALPVQVRVELAIAMSGARLDLGQPDRALGELDIPELDPDRAFSWSSALFAARAAVLEELGRDDEAAQWRRRAEIADEAIGSTEADRELLEIEEIEELELEDDSEFEATDAESADAVEAAADAVASQPREGEEA